MALALLVGLPLLGAAALQRTGDDVATAAPAPVARAAAAEPRCAAPRVELPSWRAARRATLVVDSVLLGAVPAVRGNLAGWKVTQRGRPAVMLEAIEGEIRESGRRVAPLVVIGVGYNSLWQRDRRGYATWARKFDREAVALLRTLRRHGARQLLWVTLREARRSVIPTSAHWQQRDYAWYFPYVNERLRRLARRAPDLVLADWAAVSDRPGLTYDAIHLDPDGQRLMARTIRRAIETEATRQMQQARRRARAGCTTGTAAVAPGSASTMRARGADLSSGAAAR